jgi:hypothetical protein
MQDKLERIDKEWKQIDRGTYSPIKKKGRERKLMFTWNSWDSIGYLVTDLEYGASLCGEVAIHWDDGKSTIIKRDCDTGERSTKKVKSPPYVKKLKYDDF